MKSSVPHKLIVATAVFLSVCSSAGAHGVDMFARVEGGKILGTLAFADGTPIKEKPVQALAPDGVVVEETQTDQEGRFSLPIRLRAQYRLVGDAGQGHRGFFTLRESELPPNLPVYAGVTTDDSAEVSHTHEPGSGIDSESLETAIARQLGPLREQLYAHERATRIRDVIGGVGYLFGLAGLYVLFKRRRSPGRPD
jgi:nickel transport protein